MKTRHIALALAALTLIGARADAQSRAAKITNPDPHLQAALDALDPVKRNLEAAKPDSYGYRAKALYDVGQAIDQLQRALGR